ncbi:phenylacetate--CoA ligase family protein [Salinigranum sp. GCM10025319]|uniref:phenylacetate--CoA ligase family protein n=1 Tax=Salinigranum sp. GCM10025319 TaxID=3252687 RepID=UPI0036067E60
MRETDQSATDEPETDGTARWEWWPDYAPRERIRSLQASKLTRQASRVYANAPFWRRKFEQEGVTPEMIASVDDAPDLPYGLKDEYRAAQREHPPYGGLLCRPREEIHAEGGFVWESSGTTGTPLRFLCSQREYYRTDVNATCRILWMAGLRPGDTVAMCWPLTLWAVGHGIIDAARTMNVTVLPLGPSYSSEFRVKKLDQYRPAALMTTPSYALRLVEKSDAEDVDPAAVGLDRVIVSGEPLPESTREEIAAAWDVGDAVYNYYGFSEAFNCRSIECEHHDGIHVLEDLYLCQVEREDGTLADEGELGELVVTALEQRDISTGFHFRTGDVGRYTDEACACGRTTRRIEIVSRKDDMRTIRGVNVFPQAIESVVLDMTRLGNEFRLIHHTDRSLDGLTVLAEPAPDLDRTAYEPVRDELSRRLEAAFGGMSVDVDLVAPGQLDGFDFKAARWHEEDPDYDSAI